MGLPDWFASFCSNIRVQDGGTISVRYKRITRRLNTDFWATESEMAHSLYTGSYGRNTAIQGFSDLDMLFQLPYSEYAKYDGYSTNGQSALLQAVRASLAGTYASSAVGGDGQVVVVEFTDKIRFEILPAFLNKDNVSFTYADANSGGSWRSTNPRAEIDAIRTRDFSCNGNLIQLCRMMRAWKGEWEVPIGGLLIDTLAYQFIEYWKYKDKSFLYYDWMCRDFFKWMSEQSSDQEYWKAFGSGHYVYGKRLFQYKATRCYNISKEAIAYENATPKMEYSAKQKWREIFGTSFPS